MLRSSVISPSVLDAARAALDGQHVATLRLVGSHAYGTARPDSDVDLRGVYVAPADALFRLLPPAEQIQRRDPDLTVFEVRKFAHLAAAANPTVLEVLWADGEPVMRSWAGDLLEAERDAFLSRRVRNTYGGYAQSQLEKARKGVGGSRGQGHFKREKFVLHLLRLLDQGEQLLRTGSMSVRVEDPERLHEQSRWELHRVEREFARLDAAMAAAAQATSLPDRPDGERIDRLLIAIRHGMDARGGGA